MEAGQEPSLFWSLTPRVIGVILDGAAKRHLRERDLAMSTTWHMAALGRVKKFPKLKEMLSAQPRRKRRQTMDEQIAIARQWTAALARKR